jgi:serine/threonine protein kinase
MKPRSAVQRYEDLSVKAAQLVDDLCQRFESQWRPSNSSTIAKLVASAPEELAPVALRELIAVDVACRRSQGEAVTAEAYQSRFGQLESSWFASTGAASSSSKPGKDWKPTLPDALTDYEVSAEVGRGGMGIVYRAHDHALDRPVAIKVLLPEAANSPDRLARFYREAKVISALNHPNICTIYAVSRCQGLPYLVLEWIEGVTFRSIIQRGFFNQEEVALFSQVARALEATHRRGIIHRDIKPENLIVRPDGFVKVLDFGLARLHNPVPGSSTSAPTDSLTGTLLGTVPYMSPEQVRGQRAESASDVFSLGIVLYEIATGKHPFKGPTQFDTLNAIDSVHPENPINMNPKLDPRLSQLIMRMLHKSTTSRPSAQEVSRNLDLLAWPRPGTSGQPFGSDASIFESFSQSRPADANGNWMHS